MTPQRLPGNEIGERQFPDQQAGLRATWSHVMLDFGPARCLTVVVIGFVCLHVGRTFTGERDLGFVSHREVH